MIKTENASSKIEVFSLFGSLRSVVKGTAFAYILLVISFVVLALLYTYTDMPDKSLVSAVGIISKISIFFAGFFASAMAKNRGWLHGVLAGLLYATLQTVAGYAIFKSYVPSDSILKTFALSALVATVGGIFGVNMKNKVRIKKQKNRLR